MGFVITGYNTADGAEEADPQKFSFEIKPDGSVMQYDWFEESDNPVDFGFFVTVSGTNITFKISFEGYLGILGVSTSEYTVEQLNTLVAIGYASYSLNGKTLTLNKTSDPYDFIEIFFMYEGNASQIYYRN